MYVFSTAKLRLKVASTLVAKQMTIPNAITLLRIFLVPVLVFFFYLPGSWTHTVCATIFALAALTDWIDGYLARKLHQSSEFGKFIDPVADKLIVAVSLVLIVGANGGALLAIPAVVIVGREIVISALREWMAELGERGAVSVNWLGKLKTTIQMIAIICLLLTHKGSPWYIYWGGVIALYVAATLTLWSMTLYMMAAFKTLNRSV